MKHDDYATKSELNTLRIEMSQLITESQRLKNNADIAFNRLFKLWENIQEVLNQISSNNNKGLAVAMKNLSFEEVMDVIIKDIRTALAGEVSTSVMTALNGYSLTEDDIKQMASEAVKAKLESLNAACQNRIAREIGDFECDLRKRVAKATSKATSVALAQLKALVDEVEFSPESINEILRAELKKKLWRPSKKQNEIT